MEKKIAGLYFDSFVFSSYGYVLVVRLDADDPTLTLMKKTGREVPCKLLLKEVLGFSFMETF